MEEDGVPQQHTDPGNHIIDCLGRTYCALCTLIIFFNSSNHSRESALFNSLSADEEVKV